MKERKGDRLGANAQGFSPSQLHAFPEFPRDGRASWWLTKIPSNTPKREQEELEGTCIVGSPVRTDLFGLSQSTRYYPARISHISQVSTGFSKIAFSCLEVYLCNTFLRAGLCVKTHSCWQEKHFKN